MESTFRGRHGFSFTQAWLEHSTAEVAEAELPRIPGGAEGFQPRSSCWIIEVGRIVIETCCLVCQECHTDRRMVILLCVTMCYFISLHATPKPCILKEEGTRLKGLFAAIGY